MKSLSGTDAAYEAKNFWSRNRVMVNQRRLDKTVTVSSRNQRDIKTRTGHRYFEFTLEIHQRNRHCELLLKAKLT